MTEGTAASGYGLVLGGNIALLHLRYLRRNSVLSGCGFITFNIRTGLIFQVSGSFASCQRIVLLVGKPDDVSMSEAGTVHPLCYDVLRAARETALPASSPSF